MIFDHVAPDKKSTPAGHERQVHSWDGQQHTGGNYREYSGKCVAIVAAGAAMADF